MMGASSRVRFFASYVTYVLTDVTGVSKAYTIKWNLHNYFASPGSEQVRSVTDDATPFGEALCKGQALIASNTRSGVKGTRRRRTPVASWMGLAIAAVTGTIEGSPPPSGCISGRLISTISTSGICSKRMTG